MRWDYYYLQMMVLLHLVQANKTKVFALTKLKTHASLLIPDLRFDSISSLLLSLDGNNNSGGDNNKDKHFFSSAGKNQ